MRKTKDKMMWQIENVNAIKVMVSKSGFDTFNTIFWVEELAKKSLHINLEKIYSDRALNDFNLFG